MKETVLLFQITDKKMKAAITTALLPLKVKVKQIPRPRIIIKNLEFWQAFFLKRTPKQEQEQPKDLRFQTA